ncbi:RICIN domain-containing protein, partial [Micromonospora sp. PTRAS2]
MALIEQVVPGARRRGRLPRVAAAMLAMLLGAGIVAVVPSAAVAATVDTTASYVLVNRNSGKALDLYNQATNDGARITQWTRNDGA